MSTSLSNSFSHPDGVVISNENKSEKKKVWIQLASVGNTLKTAQIHSEFYTSFNKKIDLFRFEAAISAANKEMKKINPLTTHQNKKIKELKERVNTMKAEIPDNSDSFLFSLTKCFFTVCCCSIT